MADDLVAHLTELGRMLDALDGRTVTLTGQRGEPTQDEVDAIHAGLLRKQQSGSLGLK